MAEIRAWWCPAVKRTEVEGACEFDDKQHVPLIEEGSEKAACVKWLRRYGDSMTSDMRSNALADELEKAEI